MNAERHVSWFHKQKDIVLMTSWAHSRVSCNHPILVLRAVEVKRCETQKRGVTILISDT